MGNECDQFKRREHDLCTGVATLGRKPPPQTAVMAFRQRHGLSPLPDGQVVQEATKQAIERRERRRKSPAPLTLFERFLSFGKAAAKLFAKRKGKLLTEEQVAPRIAACNSCEQLENGHCKLCGCNCSGQVKFMNKLAHADETCPDDPPKWGPVE